MTLGNAAAARVRLIVWCTVCNHQIEPGATEMAAQYGASTPRLIGASGSRARGVEAERSIRQIPRRTRWFSG